MRFRILVSVLWLMDVCFASCVPQQGTSYLGDWTGIAKVIKSTDPLINDTPAVLHIKIFQKDSGLQFTYEIIGITQNVSVITVPTINQTADHLVFKHKQKIPTHFRVREVFRTTQVDLTSKDNQLTGRLSFILDDIFLPDPQGEYSYHEAIDFEISAKPVIK